MVNVKAHLFIGMDPYLLSHHSAIHMTRALNWMHDPDMVAAFSTGVQLGSQQKVIYVNPELFSVFQIMEQERIEQEEQEELEQEMKAKMKGLRERTAGAKRKKRTQRPRVEDPSPK